MYYLVYGILYLVSLLPFFILYGISDFACFIVYRIAGYRKEVVMNNLDIAFPEKTTEEKKQIARQFYKNLTDTFIESIKLLSMSAKAFNKRAVIDMKACNELAATGLNMQYHSGHTMNWEYAHLAISKNITIPWIAFYMRIGNKTIDRLFLKIRSRYGAIMVAAQDYKSRIPGLTRGQHALGLIADQNPANGKGYWLNFFGKPVPFVTGPDKGAIINKTAVVFIRMVRLKRGYYSFEPEIITTDAQDFKDGALTMMYRDFLERNIRQQPANYLWSHRRWKWNYRPEEHKRRWIDEVGPPP